MNIAFRTDATNQIGTGHFMRCLTLAEGLKDHGANIRFVSRNLPQYLSELINQKGIELVQLPVIDNDIALDELAHSKWLGISQANDAIATINALSDKDWDWLIVDHYALDTRWENSLRKSVNKIMVIDDIADRHHDCDVLLDQNYYADMETRYTNKVPSHCKLLLGPRYALLRKEFNKLREKTNPRTGKVTRILVFLGGVDPDNYTGIVIEALSQIANLEAQVDIVIGAEHPYREQIKTSCAEHYFNCYIQTNKMAELMIAADLAIGAGGSASWERCCLGLPTLIVAFAYNQIKIAKDLGLFGGCYYLETSKKMISNDLEKTIIYLLNSQERIKVISEKAYSLVDGFGVNRVLKVISEKEKDFYFS